MGGKRRTKSSQEIPHAWKTSGTEVALENPIAPALVRMEDSSRCSPDPTRMDEQISVDIAACCLMDPSLPCLLLSSRIDAECMSERQWT